MKSWIAMICLAALAGCGAMDGHDNTPTVSDITVQNLAYGQRATFLFLGNNLELGLSATIPNCSAQTPIYTQPTQQALSCIVGGAGDLTVEVRSVGGALVYSKTFTVPKPQVIMVTSAGNISAELDPTAAPLSVANFLRYVGSGFYTNTLFHRVIAGFVIQGGGFTAGLVAQPGTQAPIALETNRGLSNLRGTLAMARTADPNSATSQFYFNLVDNTSLDYQDADHPGYAVFGKILQGLDVMDAIGGVATASTNGVPNVPVTDVVLKAVIRVQ